MDEEKEKTNQNLSPKDSVSNDLTKNEVPKFKTVLQEEMNKRSEELTALGQTLANDSFERKNKALETAQIERNNDERDTKSESSFREGLSLIQEKIEKMKSESTSVFDDIDNNDTSLNQDNTDSEFLLDI